MSNCRRVTTHLPNEKDTERQDGEIEDQRGRPEYSPSTGRTNTWDFFGEGD